jgi:hypothetical protein
MTVKNLLGSRIGDGFSVLFLLIFCFLSKRLNRSLNKVCADPARFDIALELAASQEKFAQGQGLIES